MAKIKDIANIAGVSITTVSRVLNQDKSFSVSDDTRMKILKAAEELNYSTPSMANKKKIEEETKIRIGLIYWYTTQDEFNDPYYFSIRISIENECKSHNIELEKILLSSNDISVINNNKLDGYILLGKYSEEFINRMYSLSSDIVLVDCYSPHYNIDAVISDLSQATKDIINYFLSKKINDIGFICGVEYTFDKKEIVDTRLSTYKYEMMNLNFYNEQNVYLGQFTADSGYEIMNNIIKQNRIQSSYIVASDSMAMGCLKALSEHNIKVPGRVSVISYDDTPLSQFTIPSLSTVHVNTKIMGESAVALLTEKISSGREVGKKVIIPTKLILRDSSI